MNRAFLGLLAAQAALAGMAAGFEWTASCGACRAGGLSLGLVGLAFYAGLLVFALVVGRSRTLFALIHLGFGVHLLLAAQLLSSGTTCVLCLAAAANSAVLTALSVAMDRANLARMALVLPWSVLLVLGWGAAAPSVPEEIPPPEVRVRMVVFTQEDCPYCDEFRDRILPPLREEFGARLLVDFRPAESDPSVRKTPTIVLASSRGGRGPRVIEGIPTAGMLRRAIREMEGES